MSQVWHFRRLHDGAFTGGMYSGPAQLVEANTPEGFEAVAGDPGVMVADAATPADLELSARARRDALLTASDWVPVRALEHGDPVPSAWLAYRQALRDVPGQAGFPTAIAWPALPIS